MGKQAYCQTRTTLQIQFTIQCMKCLYLQDTFSTTVVKIDQLVHATGVRLSPLIVNLISSFVHVNLFFRHCFPIKSPKLFDVWIIFLYFLVFVCDNFVIGNGESKACVCFGVAGA